MKKYNRIILNIPHSSAKLVSKWKHDKDIKTAVERWTDWFTDKIFDIENDNVEKHIFPFSRFFCDVERLLNDPLEENGDGIIKTTVGNSIRLLTEEERNEIMTIYHNYLNNLVMNATNDTLLIDCHSFPKDLVTNVDICIGFNEDWSKPADDIIQMVKEHFEKEGFTTGLNYPYSNSISPIKGYIEYQSIMIEVNKGVYMKNGEVDADEIVRLNKVMNELYGKIVGSGK